MQKSRVLQFSCWIESLKHVSTDIHWLKHIHRWYPLTRPCLVLHVLVDGSPAQTVFCKENSLTWQKKGESPLDDTDDHMIRIFSACELVYSKGHEKPWKQCHLRREEKKSKYLWHFEEVGAVFAVCLLVWCGLATNFPKCLQLLFRQAVDFDGFSVAPLSSTPAAFGRRPGVLEPMEMPRFFAVCFNCQVDSSPWLSTEHEEFPSFVQLELQKSENGKVKKCQMPQMPKNAHIDK